MKNTVLLLVLLSALACKKPGEYVEPDWNKMFPIESRTFSLRFPTQDWKLVNQQGTDSYVGYFERGADKIYFDYGWYNGTINKDSNPKPLYYEETKIDGHKALIAKQPDGNDILLRAIIYQDSMTSTALSILNPSNEQEIISIFKTHRFK
ncbi:hypothetical protein [Emticicia sp. C21]|uniref:hypothetical protein n=1 Tax=Emticicia sp. C21 TaxID=2302915 RepID=UPI000E348F5D|nr:hypothetical protein [Emticicia sp. C21]RFS15007.1 hypothetical protein D0T08_18170 [Emticicia sp. C21]